MVNDITSRHFIGNVVGIDGVTSRTEVGVATLVNKFLALCRLWNKYQEKNEDKIDVDDHTLWAQYELKGYRGADITNMKGKLKELTGIRKHNEAFIRYSATELELAYNNQKDLSLGKVFLKPKDVLPILHNLYVEMQDMATNIGKEIDIKHEMLGGAYEDLGLGLGGSYAEYTQNDTNDPTGGAFTNGGED